MASNKINEKIDFKKLGSGKKIKGLGEKTVGQFWYWAYSDVMSNVNRSALAEFVVASAIEATGRPRIEWGAYDIKYLTKKIEVKASAYVQSWSQKKFSTIRFDIAKKRSWDPDTGDMADKATRSADCYVFCLYTNKNKETVNALEVKDWEFYVVPKKLIEKELGNQKSIGKRTLESLCKEGPVNYSGLKKSIDQVLGIKK